MKEQKVSPGIAAAVIVVVLVLVAFFGRSMLSNNSKRSDMTAEDQKHAEAKEAAYKNYQGGGGYQDSSPRR